MTGDAAVWLQHTPAATSRPCGRLVCFPHAGGSSGFFRTWGRRLPDWDILSVRYPGRAERIDEPPPDDLRALAQTVAAALTAIPDDAPLVLFGHSMGAAIALETARSLEARGRDVAHLWASGSRNGPLPAPLAPADADEDDETVLSRLVRLGGTGPEAAADPVFRELVMPYVRSDGRMFHAYRMSEAPRLRCPISTIVGDADDDADRRPWPALTDAAFHETVVPGGHFYLIDAPPIALIEATPGCAPVALAVTP